MPERVNLPEPSLRQAARVAGVDRARETDVLTVRIEGNCRGTFRDLIGVVVRIAGAELEAAAAEGNVAGPQGRLKLPRLKTPAAIVVPPVYVLLPVRNNVPLPVLVSVPWVLASLRTASTVPVRLRSMLKACVPVAASFRTKPLETARLVLAS